MDAVTGLTRNPLISACLPDAGQHFAPVRGDHDHNRRRLSSRDLTNALAGLPSIHAGHLPVHKNGFERRLTSLGTGLNARQGQRTGCGRFGLPAHGMTI